MGYGLLKLFLFRHFLLYAVEDVEHLVATAGMSFVVEVAEENDDHVVGGTIEEKILESVPKTAVIDEFAVFGTFLNAIAVSINTFGQGTV